MCAREESSAANSFDTLMDAVGAGIGGAAGALVGGLFFSRGFGGRSGAGGSFEWTQSALAFTAAGAMVALVVAYIRGREWWDDQPLEDGRIPILLSHSPNARDLCRCDRLSGGNGSTSANGRGLYKNRQSQSMPFSLNAQVRPGWSEHGRPSPMGYAATGPWSPRPTACVDFCRTRLGTCVTKYAARKRHSPS